MADMTQLISLLSTLFMAVTIPVYFLFLLTLYMNWHDELLKSSFFRLMFSLGLTNLGQIFAILLGNTLASSGLVPGFYIWMGDLSARLYSCAQFGFGFAQIFGVTMIAINRLTAYVFPMKHMKIWTDSLTRNVIIIQWAVSILSIIPIAFIFDFNIDIALDNRTIYFQWTNSAQLGMYSMLVPGLCGSMMTLTIMIIYAIVFAVALIRKIRSQQAINKMEKSALKMAVVGLICSIGLILFLGDVIVQTVAWNAFHYNFLDQETNWMINNVGNSLFAGIDPYAMFLFSPTVRHRFVRLVCGCGRKSESGSTVTSVKPFSTK